MSDGKNETAHKTCPRCKGTGKRDSSNVLGPMVLMFGDKVLGHSAGPATYSVRDQWECDVCEGKGAVDG